MADTPAATAFQDTGIVVCPAVFQSTDAIKSPPPTNNPSRLLQTFSTIYPAPIAQNVYMGSSAGICVFNGTIFVAFQANDSSHNLFVTQSADGVTWNSPAKFIKGITIGSAPSMTVFNNKIFMAFQANDPSHNLFVTQSADGATWNSPATSIKGITIGSAPSMTVFNNKIFMAFQANDGSNELLVTSSSDGTSWTTPTTLPAI